MGRTADLAEKKVRFSAKNNGNTRRSLERFSCYASGHREMSRDRFLQEQSMPAHHRN